MAAPPASPYPSAPEKKPGTPTKFDAHKRARHAYETVYDRRPEAIVKAMELSDQHDPAYLAGLAKLLDVARIDARDAGIMAKLREKSAAPRP